MKQNGPLLFQDFRFNNQQNVFLNGLNSNYVFSRNDQQAPPGPPPRWGGMLSKRPPTSCLGTRPVPCSPPSDDQGQQGFNYRPQPHTQVDSQLVVCAIVELHHQQIFIPGRPPGPTQSAWSVVRVSIPQELGSTLRLTC